MDIERAVFYRVYMIHETKKTAVSKQTKIREQTQGQTEAAFPWQIYATWDEETNTRTDQKQTTQKLEHYCAEKNRQIDGQKHSQIYRNIYRLTKRLAG